MRYLYHVSRVLYRDEIREGGLIPSRPTEGPHYGECDYLDGQPKAIYVWPNLKCAVMWQMGLVDREIWRFPRVGFKSRRDPYFQTQYKYGLTGNGYHRALYIEEPVAPNLLELIDQ